MEKGSVDDGLTSPKFSIEGQCYRMHRRSRGPGDLEQPPIEAGRQNFEPAHRLDLREHERTQQ
jgi:hypothetical protein